MVEKLLPCPFCGTENVELYRPVLSSAWAVHCDDCGFKGRTGYNVPDAITAWNTRAPADLRSALEVETIERCAKVAEEQYAGTPGWSGHYQNAGTCIATAIRALAPTKEPAA